MTTILVAADAIWVRDLVRSAFTSPGQKVIDTSRGQDVRDIVDREEPELVVLDLQIANMGGVAVALDLRLEEAAGRLPGVPIILLLDREADRFIAGRADVDIALVKPVDAGQLRKIGLELLAAQAAVEA
jgi:DNA-binding response OmpR family regulator